MATTEAPAWRRAATRIRVSMPWRVIATVVLGTLQWSARTVRGLVAIAVAGVMLLYARVGVEVVGAGVSAGRPLVVGVGLVPILVPVGVVAFLWDPTPGITDNSEVRDGDA